MHDCIFGIISWMLKRPFDVSWMFFWRSKKSAIHLNHVLSLYSRWAFKQTRFSAQSRCDEISLIRQEMCVEDCFFPLKLLLMIFKRQQSSEQNRQSQTTTTHVLDRMFQTWLSNSPISTRGNDADSRFNQKSYEFFRVCVWPWFMSIPVWLWRLWCHDVVW